MTEHTTVPEPPPGAPVVDFFDQYSPEYAMHRFDWYRDMFAKGPVVWTPFCGGHWVVLGRDELVEAAKNWQVFSSRGEIDGRRNGMFSPPRDYEIPLIEDDPPRWEAIRKAVNPAFLPGEVLRWHDRIEELVDHYLDERIETGTIDFCNDIINVVPAIFTLEFVGITARDFRESARVHNLSSHLSPADPDWPEIMAAQQWEREAIREEAQRLEKLPPGERGRSLIARLLDARSHGTDLSDEILIGLAMLTIAAGIDTTAAAMCASLVMIDRDDDLRRRFAENPDLIRPAFQEFLRLATPTSGLTRTAMCDTELGGQKIRRGDRVMLCYAAASRDPREFVEPDTFRFDRRANRHTGFGSGIHRCIGAHYAELEFELIVGAIMRRMPDFRIDHERVVRHTNIGVVDGWISLPATFTPGSRQGATGISEQQTSRERA